MADGTTDRRYEAIAKRAGFALDLSLPYYNSLGQLVAANYRDFFFGCTNCYSLGIPQGTTIRTNIAASCGSMVANGYRWIGVGGSAYSSDFMQSSCNGYTTTSSTRDLFFGRMMVGDKLPPNQIHVEDPNGPTPATFNCNNGQRHYICLVEKFTN